MACTVLDQLGGEPTAGHDVQPTLRDGMFTKASLTRTVDVYPAALVTTAGLPRAAGAARPSSRCPFHAALLVVVALELSSTSPAASPGPSATTLRPSSSSRLRLTAPWTLVHAASSASSVSTVERAELPLYTRVRLRLRRRLCVLHREHPGRVDGRSTWRHGRHRRAHHRRGGGTVNASTTERKMYRQNVFSAQFQERHSVVHQVQPRRHRNWRRDDVRRIGGANGTATVRIRSPSSASPG